MPWAALVRDAEVSAAAERAAGACQNVHAHAVIVPDAPEGGEQFGRLTLVAVARFHDLGSDYHTTRIDKNRKTRSHVRQLEALGYTGTLAPAA